MSTPIRSSGRRRLQPSSRAGNPIRRAPNSGASASSISSNDSEHFLPMSNIMNNNSSNVQVSPERSRHHLARNLLAIACLWPLLFLIIPPPTADPAHMAILSAGINSSSKSFTNKFQSIKKRAHDKIDNIRAVASRRVNLAAKTQFLREEMSTLLRRKDIVGYGPDRPRVAVVVVVPQPSNGNNVGRRAKGGGEGDEESRILKGALDAVQSVFLTTDRNRIFIVTVVMDGRGKVGTFEAKLDDIDAGRTMHRHGGEVHTHDHHHELEGEQKEGEGHYHSEKIHTLYNHEGMGVSASRKEAVHFINVLSRKHEQAGIKSPEEDLILLFLSVDSRLKEFDDDNQTWLDDVTDALILSPSIDENQDISNKFPSVAKKDSKVDTKPTKDGTMQPSNAVSFAVDTSSSDTEGNVEIHSSHVGVTLSFDQKLRPRPSSATGQQLALSNGESYPTPLTQSATALRLRTYNAFPASDEALTSHYSADLELSFNLWMCADGIDVIASSYARVVVDPVILSSSEKDISGPLAARIVSAWMSGHGDDVYADKILRAVAERSAQDSIIGMTKDHSMSDRKLLVDKIKVLNDMLVRISSEAKHSSSFPTGLGQKCRPFSWYAQNVHPQNDFHEEEDVNDAKKKAWMNGPTTKEEGSATDENNLPSKPLNEDNMAIISKTSPVNIKYVDASGGHAEHPHKGATDENGKFGYVHDETFLIKNPPTFEIKDEKDRGVLCKKGDPNYQMLTKKVFVDLPNHEAAEKRAEHGLAKKGRAKIFCLVYTIEKNHHTIPAIKETWGKKCDGFMVASTKTDRELGTVNIPHEGPEEYNNIWQKVRSMWSYVYDNYYEKYDWFHIGGDDLYLIVENLRLYLESEEIQLASNGGQYLPNGSEETQTPLFLGRRFAEGGNMDRIFISGGSGYTMNKATLKTLVVDGLPKCRPHFHTFSEDVMVANCLRQRNILPYDTKDEAGGERYMPFAPGHHLNYHPPANPKDDWYSNYSINCKWGIDHCAAKSVAFHYIKGDLMRRMYAILYHYC
mmetsp:Transcript_3160/g.6616  ORF Transcript_3160/g.6616 Transcript_3160/m.6616 type:complete len:1023 (+) Transcript_3160:49-3117(+)